jgi:Dyp-type peroxidase family
MTMGADAIDYRDVQGLVRFGHGHLKEACFLLLRVDQAAPARAWLGAARFTTAETAVPPPDTALQVALTCEGLQALGVSREVLKKFSPEFLAGMAGDESRSRRLGDVGANSPAQWQWGSPGRVPHLLLTLYARPGGLQDFKQTVVAGLPQGGVSLLACLDTVEENGYEPFGFKDGISQPELDWELQRRVEVGKQITYSNLISLGEFLLGYPNEYGLYTDRPLLEENEDPGALLLPAVDEPGKRDLARNGTYLVFRHLRQDVQGFWRFLDEQAGGDPAVRQRLAEAMVGRSREGVPLAGTTEQSIPGIEDKGSDAELNRFTYAGDRDGVRCPFGAHVRRANPRNADLPDGTEGLLGRLIRSLGFCRESIRTDTIASSRFHRLLRRGRKYGSRLTQEEAIRQRPTEGEEQGLYFVSLNGNIGRQFEFVQNAWIMGTKFDRITEEGDPLLGNRQPLASGAVTDTFSRPQKSGLRDRVTGLPQFVTVRGGAYFFLPGIRALRYLASIPG